MAKAITCNCSNEQLDRVGCDCVASRDAVKVQVWLKGYASDYKATIFVDGGLNVDQEVRNRCGSFAKAYQVTRLFPDRLPVSVPVNQIQPTNRDNS